jgi:lipopolysaccharide transport system ATP-binding protein
MTRDAPITIALAGISKIFPQRGISLPDLFRPPTSGGFHALADVTLVIRSGETVGFLGMNGAGKSTLLQIITGTLKPTDGDATVRGRISALLELGAGFNPEWTGRRNSEFYCMAQGASLADIPTMIAAIEEFADVGVFFDQPVRTYSSGMFLRVAFAAAIAIDPDIVIVDEALAVGDARFQNKCYNKFKQLQAAGKTILVVTHDPVLVGQFCTRGVVMHGGRIVVDASPDEAVTAYRKLLYGGAVGEKAEEAPPQADALAKDAAAPDLPSLPVAPAADSAGAFRDGPHYNPHETVAGSAAGQISDIRVYDDAGLALTGTIPAGRRIRVSVSFNATRAIRKAHFGFVLKSRDNVLVYGVSNEMLGAERGPIEPGDVFSVSFGVDTRLAGGDYFVDIGLAEGDGSELDVVEWRMSVLHLTIENPQAMFGFSDLAGTFQRHASATEVNP